MFKKTSILDLKISRFSAFTIFSGRLFHAVTLRMANECFRWLLLAFWTKSFLLCPLVRFSISPGIRVVRYRKWLGNCYMGSAYRVGSQTNRNPSLTPQVWYMACLGGPKGGVFSRGGWQNLGRLKITYIVHFNSKLKKNHVLRANFGTWRAQGFTKGGFFLGEGSKI